MLRNHSLLNMIEMESLSIFIKSKKLDIEKNKIFFIIQLINNITRKNKYYL